MATDHPFQNLFETFGRLPSAHAESVNRKAGEALAAALDRPVEAAGSCILLRAPRAGYGKTHLLSRIQHRFGGSHEFIPLHVTNGRTDADSVTEDALKRLTRPLPAAGGMTVLDLVSRRLFAFALQPLVVSGEVPCQDREGALTALRARPVETFDFHHPNAVTAHWAKENFEVLGPRLSMELAQRTGLPPREVSFWVNALFRYSSTSLDYPSRTGALNLEATGQPVSESQAVERLVTLLGLLSQLMRVVLVADDLEGFSADETAALKFSAFVTGVRHAADRVDVILSLNKDVWESAFLPRLSGGLADRLSEVLIDLEPLSDEEIVALLDSRAPGLGEQVYEKTDRGERHPRALIRAAGIAWLKASSERETAEREIAEAVYAPEETAKVEAELELKAAHELVDAVVPEPQPEPAPQIVFSPVHTEFSSVFESRPQPEPPVGILEPEPYFPPQAEAVPPVFQPVWEPVFEPAPPPPVWEPVVENPPFQPQSTGFQSFQPQENAGFSQPPVFGSQVFEAAPPTQAEPPQQPGCQSPPQDEGADRVDDLLKQFRERYGR